MTRDNQKIALLTGAARLAQGAGRHGYFENPDTVK